MPYLTLDALKAYLGITSADDDALLTDTIVRACAAVDVHTGRTFAAAAETTRRFDARRDVSEDGRALHLRDDLVQVTAVINGDGALVPPDAYTTRPLNGGPFHTLVLKAGSGLAWTFDDEPASIAVTGRWTFSLTAPPDIVQAALRLAAHFYRARDAAAPADALPGDVRDLLAPYRRTV